MRAMRSVHRETRRERAQRIADAYGLVLVLILATFGVTMTLPPEGWGGRVTAVVFAGLTAVVAFTSSGVAPRRVRLATGIAVAADVAAVGATALSSDLLLGLAFVAVAVLLAAAAFVILRRVVLASEVDFKMILGAINVFTLFGLLFGFLYIALGRLQGGGAFAGLAHARSSDYLFFSYTTLTTTGYGNLVPAGTVGQSLAVIEMLVGQVFMVTLVARLVSVWKPRAKSDTPG